MVRTQTWIPIALLFLALPLGGTFLLDDDTTNSPAPTLPATASGSTTSSTNFKLTTNPPKVTRVITENVTLVCAHNQQGSARVHDVSRIRIMRKQPGDVTDTWKLLAELTLANTSALRDDNFEVNGTIKTDSPKETFLLVTWPFAVRSTFGTYRCDVIGLDSSLFPVAESTESVTISEIPATTDDLLSILLQTRTEMERLSEDLNRRIQQQDYALERFKDTALLHEDVNVWPDGSYALLQPQAGCPADLAFLNGGNSFVKIHTESSDSNNHNSFTDMLPVWTATIEDHSRYFFTLRFCEARGNKNFGRPGRRYWPRGTYCINKLPDSPCPYRFVEGSAFLDAEDDNRTDSFSGRVVTEVGDRVKLEFCCQEYSPPAFLSTKMKLPTDYPFLLYKKGRSCPLVEGMVVKSQRITIDTEDNNNGDSVGGSTPAIAHVTGPGQPVRIELCYYSKQ